jgi:hypothetical protein
MTRLSRFVAEVPVPNSVPLPSEDVEELEESKPTQQQPWLDNGLSTVF